MRFQFLPERIRKSQGIGLGWFPNILVEPEPHLIEEVDSAAIPDLCALSFLVSPKEDRASEDSFKALGQTPVMSPVQLKSPLVQNPGAALEVHQRTFLAHCDGCHR